MGDRAEVGRRLEEARKRAGLSVRRLCTLAEFDMSQWYKIQRGRGGLGAEKAKDLAEVLHVDPAWLLGWDREPPEIPEVDPGIRLMGEWMAGLPVEVREKVKEYGDFLSSQHRKQQRREAARKGRGKKRRAGT